MFHIHVHAGGIVLTGYKSIQWPRWVFAQNLHLTLNLPSVTVEARGISLHALQYFLIVDIYLLVVVGSVARVSNCER